MVVNGSREFNPDDLPEISETENVKVIQGHLKNPDPRLRILDRDTVQRTDDPEDI